MVFFYGIMIADKLELGLPQWLGKERRSRNLSVFVSFDSVGFSIASEIGILRRNRLQLSGPDQVDDDSGYLRIELCPGAAFKLACDHIQREGLLVNSLGGHCVKAVGAADDPRHEWNVFALDPFGIARTVILFMMGLGALDNLRDGRDPFQDRGAARGMALHDGEFLVGQFPRLVQNAVPDSPQ